MPVFQNPLVPECPVQFSADEPSNLGSILHGTGKCRPCAWFWKPVGCQNDRTCGYCHLCPESELKNRKKSKQNLLRLGLPTPTAAGGAGGAGGAAGGAGGDVEPQ